MSQKLKNCHYKSTQQFYTTATQELTAANTIANPIVPNSYRIVTDTGVAIDDGVVLATGTYRLSGDVTLEGTTAGVVTVAITDNTTALPETVISATVGSGETVSIHTETVRYFESCCNIQHPFDLVVYSDGTAVADVTLMSGNIIKLA